MPAAKPTEALIQRTLRAWMTVGLPVGSISVRGDGSVQIFAPEDSQLSRTPLTDNEVQLCDAAFGVVR